MWPREICTASPFLTSCAPVPTSAGTSAPLRASIHGTFEITTAGTIIPSIALDVAAAAVVVAGSFFECIYIGPAAALGGFSS